jgi:molybdopterin molybdotransferase
VIPLAEAQRRILAGLGRLPEVAVRLDDALGLALAADVKAGHDVPPFANSAMDGYAVRAADVAEAGAELVVIGTVAAGGIADGSVQRGTAIKIMTGAPLPEGAEAVVRVEDTEASSGGVRILAAVAPGTSVRRAGGDVREGTILFTAGTRLTPVHLAMLATIGVAEPLVGRRPRVAVASTGDELVSPTVAELGPGQIRDSNRPMLKALLAEVGAEVIDFGIIGDEPDRLRSFVTEAAAGADLVVTSGGVSMGDRDVVKETLAGGVEFWQVAIQPAKPLGFGSVGGTPFFGLPGNPVSVMVAFEQFVRPGLLWMMGSRRLLRPRVMGRTGVDLDTDPAKTVFVRVRTWMEDELRWAEPSGGQASNVLSAVAAGDAFAVVPHGTGLVAAGESVALEMFRWPEERTIDEIG